LSVFLSAHFAESNMGISKTWELDFYSRPILDENQKKIWELLVCDPERTFEYVQCCSGAEANARWLQTTLEEAIQAWRTSHHLSPEARPERIRFFRRQMNSIITRACEQLEIPAQPSRRTLALYEWLRERAETVYSQHPGFQPMAAPPVQFDQGAAMPLPDPIQGKEWAFVNLQADVLEEAAEWDMSFGEVFSVTRKGIDPQAQLPGLIIYSPRAIPLSGWMSGLELAFVKVAQDTTPKLILETGASDRWILANLRTPQLLAEAQAFEAAKQNVRQFHFLAVQTHPQSQTFAGFWVLQEADLP
jgi:hypothetical protein